MQYSRKCTKSQRKKGEFSEKKSKVSHCHELSHARAKVANKTICCPEAPALLPFHQSRQQAKETADCSRLTKLGSSFQQTDNSAAHFSRSPFIVGEVFSS